MLAKEKACLLKETIRKLYVDEGRSISYIYRLLQIDRHTLSTFIKENNFVQFNQDKKRIINFLKEHKEKIISEIKKGKTNREICSLFHIGELFYKKVLAYDKELVDIKNDLQKDYFEQYEKIDKEIWKPILGFEDYEVSNFGRVKRGFKIIKPCLNKTHDRYYISLQMNNKRKTFILARIVAHTFCNGFSDVNNTVNHKDGNTHNNNADNLEWVSQSENNKHSYNILKRVHISPKPINYIILYNNKYQFKTITALARFLNVSPTQARRYISNPEKHNIIKLFK